MIAFSKNGYRKLLTDLLQNGYECITFKELRQTSKNKPYVLLRHDVDTSLELALEMAKIEAELNVHSTFFVMLRSPMYNLFSRYNTKALWEIKKLGHDLGLHFDAAFTDECPLPITHYLAQEIEILENTADYKVSSFSLHQPSQRIISQQITYKNLINTYNLQQLGNFEYISDSNRNWRDKSIYELIQNRKNIQLLTHPMWWMLTPQNTQDCWSEVIKRNFDNEEKQVLATERAYGTHRSILIQEE